MSRIPVVEGGSERDMSVRDRVEGESDTEGVRIEERSQ